eukprot:6189221-Pleurochrysis_carterae.AAC.2
MLYERNSAVEMPPPRNPTCREPLRSRNLRPRMPGLKASSRPASRWAVPDRSSAAPGRPSVAPMRS